MKKNISRESLVASANNVFSSKEFKAEEKLAIASFIESVLHKNDSYEGYTIDDIPINDPRQDILEKIENPRERFMKKQEMLVSTRKYF